MKSGDIVRALESNDDVYVAMLDDGEFAYFYEYEIELFSECDEDI